MSVATLSLSRSARGDAADRAARASAMLLACYLVVTTWPMTVYLLTTADLLPFVLHAAALALAVRAAIMPADSARTLRDWLPFALGPLLYVELRWLIPGAGRPHQDALVQRWELALFHGQPSATWAPHLPNAALSELLHLCYLSYYLLVYVPPLLLYIRGRRDAFIRTMLALTLVYGSCFAVYLLFPVDGPRFLVGPAAAPNGPIRTVVLHLLASGSSRGTAFPSSHIAASVVASLCALQFQRAVGIIVALLTVGLTLATVYGGFHYGVDGIAGMLLGIVTWLFAAWIWRRLSRQGEQSATAA
jgi:membrane-associated phospholipid phosphatase